MDMTREEIMDLMLNSINEDNRAMGLQAGISDDDMEMQIAQSQASLSFMMSNIYDKLKDSGVIA
jgi:hypothetical protein